MTETRFVDFFEVCRDKIDEVASSVFEDAQICESCEKKSFHDFDDYDLGVIRILTNAIMDDLIHYYKKCNDEIVYVLSQFGSMEDWNTGKIAFSYEKTRDFVANTVRGEVGNSCIGRITPNVWRCVGE